MLNVWVVATGRHHRFIERNAMSMKRTYTIVSVAVASILALSVFLRNVIAQQQLLKLKIFPHEI